VKKSFNFCLLIILLFSANLYSQYDNNISSHSPPWVSTFKNIDPKSFLYNPYTTAYAYILNGVSSHLYRFSVGNPGAMTPIGSDLSNITLENGDFANPTGIWKFYVQDAASPYTIYEVDTSNGTITSVGAPTNLKSGHKPRVIAWDHTTNTFYIVSSNATQTETQLYSMYWPTKELSWIGPSVSPPAQIWSGAFNANGNFFGIDNITYALWKVNKYTGEWTQVGPLGRVANYYQTAGFDKSNFSRMLWCGWGDTAGVYEVDTITGHSTLIGPYGDTRVVIALGLVPAYGPQISHTPLQNTQNLTGPYSVNAAIISTGSGISSAKLFWSRNNATVTDSGNMTNTSGNNWTGNIPGNGQIATYRYYIWAKDSLNRTAASPFGAPGNLYMFNTVGPDSIKPVISHTPLGNINILQWPDSVNATVTDNSGIDSVWVNWRINNSVARHFKLSNSTGNIYLAKFNSTYSDVLAGDTIYYRIIAKDNSLSHNKDSTNLFSFIITTADYNCIGNENATITDGPFETFFESSKTQMLYTASEILSNGGVRGSITKMAFYILQADTMTMHNFNIKMQNTSLSVLNNGFINTGWSMAYSGRYAVQSTGWQFINLQTPFYWDSTSNLLIEVCISNTTTSSIGTYVQGTTSAQMYYWGYRTDTLACSVNPTNAYASSEKPNICFKIEPALGFKKNLNYIPTAYKLYQNYPNPFNPVTKINYDILKEGYVSLRIFDILGRKVKTLVSEVKSTGSYSIDYEASGLSSGIYLYMLECNGFIDTKRMILLK